MDATTYRHPSSTRESRQRRHDLRLKTWLHYHVFYLLIVLITFLSNAGSVHSAANWSPTTSLRVSRTVLASDCTQRESVVINGSSPGPELRFQAGERVWVRVYNDLENENTTMHWHGISQYGTPFSDGTALSQYVIPAGSFFDYEFELPLSSAGTYIYHGHIDLDIISAYGALIIEEREPPPYHYNSEITLVFGDYFHSKDAEISSKLTSRPFKALTKPSSILVNGNALGECQPNGTTTQCEAGCRHYVIEVEPSKTYRVRAIGITTLSFLSIAIEGHRNLSFIEVDSHYIQKIDSDHLEIHSGQRYSFLLKTKSLSELRATSNQGNLFWGRMETRWRPERDKGAFLIKYKIPESSTKDAVDSCRTPAPKDLDLRAPLPDESVDWILDDFSPLSDADVPPSASLVTRRLFFSGQQSKTAGGGVEWLVNGVAYAESSQLVPYLVAAYQKNTELHPDYKAAAQNHGFDPKTTTFPIQYGEVVEMVVLNRASSAGTTEAHPWHFHGQSPYYIASGTGEFTRQALRQALAKRKGKPYQRDTQVIFSGRGATWKQPTSLIPAGTASGWFLMRMQATHVGAFLLHCHIGLHMMMGMGATLLIGLEHLPKIPEEIVQEYMTFNPNRKDVPTSFFDNVQHSKKVSRFRKLRH
ncbi:hypothetical protein CROQUDRAFT_90966 [Cronartium quercuum f. sp. fusiforme G11]|uniref:laccase n=1 Tax=Cronartium quercuum f. sp. fusiforme G11 TaxID=708437 RepID=A0A9P6TDJ8_9BASI|nr:hypothetical protein CROQUDRAFT_90966 [Cronartium quercuum f. sp. fusiforme G11]